MMQNALRLHRTWARPPESNFQYGHTNRHTKTKACALQATPEAPDLDGVWALKNPGSDARSSRAHVGASRRTLRRLCVLGPRQPNNGPPRRNSNPEQTRRRR